MTVEMDGSVHIAWTTNEHSEIRVYAPKRSNEELTAFARRVADHALVARSLPELRRELREEFKATFDIDSRPPRSRDEAGSVVIRLLPPRGEPNPE